MGFQLPTSTGDLRISEPFTVVPPISTVGNIPRIGSQSVPWQNVEQKIDGWDSISRMVGFSSEKNGAPGVVSLAENVSKMCFSLNVFPKICKIFSCCNKNPGRMCLGSGQGGSRILSRHT